MKDVLEEFGEHAWWCEICDEPTPPGWMMCEACEDKRSKQAED